MLDGILTDDALSKIQELLGTKTNGDPPPPAPLARDLAAPSLVLPPRGFSLAPS